MKSLMKCFQCKHSVFVYEAYPYGDCCKDGKVILKGDNACKDFEPGRGALDGKDE